MSYIVSYKSSCHNFAMYIAFKWLLGLTLTMWIAMCCLDAFAFVKKNTVMSGEGFNIMPLAFETDKNRTAPIINKLNSRTERYKHIDDKQHNMAYLHCVMFLAGALVVSVYNRLNDIILVTKREFSSIFTNANVTRLRGFSKSTATSFYKFATIFFKDAWQNLKNIVDQSRVAIYAQKFIKKFEKPRINIILLKKLKEIGEERKNLAQLLLAAIHENKNIRMQYQIENMAKKRLVRHIENTQKAIKENRSRYVSFQQLYLVTHQENTFLKCRLKKLTKEKDEAEKNLLELMNEVYKSKNNELKAYCSRFIVKSRENLLNSDVGAEIQKFLRKGRGPVTTAPNWHLSERSDNEVNTANSWLKCSSSSTQITEIIKDEDTLVPLVSEAPKLKGLPGEYVWTIKDKDGMIEKLYEYDCESENNGDTISRIREYSVYYDKDCLLDFSNSATNLNENRSDRAGMRSPYMTANYPLTSRRFLTGSDAFRKFMQNNNNLVSTSLLPTPPLLSN